MDLEAGLRGCGLVLFGLLECPVAGCCEHSDEPSESVTGGGFLDGVSFSVSTLLLEVSLLIESFQNDHNNCHSHFNNIARQIENS
jgi:hypothetical protein